MTCMSLTWKRFPGPRCTRAVLPHHRGRDTALPFFQMAISWCGGGGGGQTALTADLHVLDTVHKMWSGALQLNKFSPEPRVGHSVHVLAACQLHLLPLCFDVYTAFNR